MSIYVKNLGTSKPRINKVLKNINEPLLMSLTDFNFAYKQLKLDERTSVHCKISRMAEITNVY